MVPKRRSNKIKRPSVLSMKPTGRGCPQGACLSPIAFLLILDPLLRKLIAAGFIT